MTDSRRLKLVNSKYERTVQRGAQEVADLVGGVRYASRTDVRRQAKDWSTSVLQCRKARKHSFIIPVTAYVVQNKRYSFAFERVRCSNGCGVELEREMNRHGHIYWSRPIYPPGYLSGTGRIEGDARDELNLITFKRVNPNPTVIRRFDDDYVPHGGYEE